MRKTVFIILALISVGCSTFSKRECEEKDWMTLGYDAAMSGRTAINDIQYFQRECGSEHGVQPDVNLFSKGYESGLREFCTPGNGLRYGRSGGLYNNTCAKVTEKEFLEKYQLGRIEYTGSRLHELENQVEQLRQDNRNKDDRIRDLENRLNGKSP